MYCTSHMPSYNFGNLLTFYATTHSNSSCVALIDDYLSWLRWSRWRTGGKEHVTYRSFYIPAGSFFPNTVGGGLQDLHFWGPPGLEVNGGMMLHLFHAPSWASASWASRVRAASMLASPGSCISKRKRQSESETHRIWQEESTPLGCPSYLVLPSVRAPLASVSESAQQVLALGRQWHLHPCQDQAISSIYLKCIAEAQRFCFLPGEQNGLEPLHFMHSLEQHSDVWRSDLRTKNVCKGVWHSLYIICLKIIHTIYKSYNDNTSTTNRGRHSNQLTRQRHLDKNTVSQSLSSRFVVSEWHACLTGIASLPSHLLALSIWAMTPLATWECSSTTWTCWSTTKSLANWIT